MMEAHDPIPGTHEPHTRPYWTCTSSELGLHQRTGGSDLVAGPPPLLQR